MVLVQGDTTTTLCGALAAFYRRIPVGHVEAGLRTGDLAQPFPEEMNRVVVSRLAALHFAATEKSAENLRREGVDPDRVHITGNSGIDAVLYVKAALESGQLTAPASGRLARFAQTDRSHRSSPGELRRRVRADLQRARGSGIASGCSYRAARAPQSECARTRSAAAGRPRQRYFDRSAGIRALRGFNAASLDPHYRFRWHSGGRSVARQAGAGDEGKNREARSCRSRHGETGRHRSGLDSA